MNHKDHVNLLKPANLLAGGVWADLGAGEGAFTLALRELVGPKATIYAVDKDAARLNELQDAYQARVGSSSNLILLKEELSSPLGLPALDGVVMANSLHFFKDRETILRHVRTLLKPKGILLLVEYNVDKGNMWVPYPLSFETYRKLAPSAGFSEPRLIGKVPSRFLKEIYSAVCYKEG